MAPDISKDPATGAGRNSSPADSSLCCLELERNRKTGYSSLPPSEGALLSFRAVRVSEGWGLGGRPRDADQQHIHSRTQGSNLGAQIPTPEWVTQETWVRRQLGGQDIRAWIMESQPQKGILQGLDGKSETQRGTETYSGSHSQATAEGGFEPRILLSQPSANSTLETAVVMITVRTVTSSSPLTLCQA